MKTTKHTTETELEAYQPFTVVYRGLTQKEVKNIMSDKKTVWFGWCHAPYERDEARAAITKATGAAA